MKQITQLPDVERQANRCAVLEKIANKVLDRDRALRIQNDDDWIMLFSSSEQERPIITKFLEDLMKVNKDALIEMVNNIDSEKA